MTRMRKILSISLDKPAENVDIYSFDEDIPISKIRKEIKKHKNCRLSVRKERAYMVCGR